MNYYRISRFNPKNRNSEGFFDKATYEYDDWLEYKECGNAKYSNDEFIKQECAYLSFIEKFFDLDNEDNYIECVENNNVRVDNIKVGNRKVFIENLINITRNKIWGVFNLQGSKIIINDSYLYCKTSIEINQTLIDNDGFVLYIEKIDSHKGNNIFSIDS